MSLPARQQLRIVRQRRLNDDATLVPGRPQELLDERVHDVLIGVTRIDHDEVDAAHEGRLADRRPKGQHGCPDDLAVHPGDENQARGPASVHQLAEEVGTLRRKGAPVAGTLDQPEDPLEIGDPSVSDLVFHSAGWSLMVRLRFVVLRVRSEAGPPRARYP